MDKNLIIEVKATANGNIQGYVKEFDALRALAVLGVMFSHYFGQIFFSGLFGMGGVTLFFVLSGYLITQILLKEKEKMQIDYATNLGKLSQVLKVFYIRRSLRIFPIFYITLAVLFILNIDSTRQFFAYHFFYASNFLYSFGLPYDHLSHFWSLAVEEQFYLVWPLIVLLVPFKANKVLFFGVLVAGSLVFKLAMLYLYSVESLAIHFMMPSCIEAFGLGAMVVLIAKKEISKKWIMFCFFGSLFIFCLLHAGLFIHVPPVYKTISVLFGRFFFSLFSATILLIILKGYHKGIFKQILLNRFLIFLGKISYGMYIYHMFMPGLFTYLQKLAGINLAGTGLHMVLNFAGTFLIAYLSFVLIEKPVNNLKKHFTY